MADSPGMQFHRRRLLGVRLWLALIFAGIGIFSGASVYLFVSDQSDQAADERSTEVALGRTLGLAQQLGNTPRSDSARVVDDARSTAFAAWAFGPGGRLLSEETVIGVSLDQVPNRRLAVERALTGGRIVEEPQAGVTVVALPVSRNNRLDGAVLARATRPQEVRSALQALRGERLTSMAIAVGIAAVVGFGVATLISTRVTRLARGARRLAEGRLDRPIEPSGRDEIGDLGRALEAMRVALSDTFDALSSERDRLSAIFAALGDAVMVVGRWGDVRFSNPAADRLIVDGRLIEPLDPWLSRATHLGRAEHDALRIGERVYGLQARDLPAEDAVLLVVRDRTDELQREIAEREFVSNAAHELRNPIAGISGTIEVLKSGAKDDPEARDHFLDRLSADADKVTKLTQSLLTLARIEAISEGAGEVVSVELASKEAATAVEVPEGIELSLAVEEELTAQADPVLLRQVLIGLLTNAFKHTEAPGAVTLRARRSGDEHTLIEIEDTGSGIPEEEQKRVFERFYRGEGSLEREGFGLGLSIAKRMIDVMGGEIGVTSTEGEGSTFWLKLRLSEHSPTPVA